MDSGGTRSTRPTLLSFGACEHAPYRHELPEDRSACLPGCCHLLCRRDGRRDGAGGRFVGRTADRRGREAGSGENVLWHPGQPALGDRPGGRSAELRVHADRGRHRRGDHALPLRRHAGRDRPRRYPRDGDRRRPRRDSGPGVRGRRWRFHRPLDVLAAGAEEHGRHRSRREEPRTRELRRIARHAEGPARRQLARLPRLPPPQPDACQGAALPREPVGTGPAGARTDGRVLPAGPAVRVPRRTEESLRATDQNGRRRGRRFCELSGEPAVAAAGRGGEFLRLGRRVPASARRQSQGPVAAANLDGTAGVVAPRHPDDAMVWDTPGQPASFVVASPEYRRDAAASLAALVRHLEEKFGPSMAGYHPCGQNTGEWFYQETWGPAPQRILQGQPPRVAGVARPAVRR